MALKELPVVFCAECGKPFYRTQRTKIFCDGECRQTAWNRRVSGGFKLYELVMKWRIERPKNALNQLTAEADLLAAEERDVRCRRNARIAKEQTEYPRGILPETFNAGKTVSENVKLAPAQRLAVIAAAEYCLAVAAGRKPNDPKQSPENWDRNRIKALENALSTLSGGAPQA